MKNEGHSDGTPNRIASTEKDWATQMAWQNLTDTYWDTAELTHWSLREARRKA